MGTLIIKKLIIGVMILVGCIGFTMNANAERQKVTRMYTDCEGSMLVWEDTNLDGVNDVCYVFLRGQGFVGTVSPEEGERIRITAIRYCDKIKRQKQGDITI